MEQKKTVLIVEDEKNIVDIIRFNLQRTGYNTLEAYDGEAGLAMAREKKPDLILLDVMMPKMMGFDVCRALRAEGERVILSTADSDTAYDCVFILRPAVALTTLLPALETADGAVRVDADMQTNIPGVFAAGDITGAPYQAARAVGQGNTAALSIARFLHQGDAINHESTN